MIAHLSVATASAIINAVAEDPSCQRQIPWKLAGVAPVSGPWFGEARNFTMETQSRTEEFVGGNPWALISPGTLSLHREKNVCFGISQWTSIAINKAILGGGRMAAALSEVEVAAPIATRAMAHEATGIRLKRGLSGAVDTRTPADPLLAYIADFNDPRMGNSHVFSEAFSSCDFVFDWWYHLSLLNPLIFLSQGNFDKYFSGMTYVSSPLAVNGDHFTHPKPGTSPRPRSGQAV